MSQTTKKKSEQSDALSAIKTMQEFESEIMDIHARPEEREAVIEVTEDFFRGLAKGRKTEYLTYGDPGVKVFIAGTRDRIESEEAMTAEQYRELHIRRTNEAAR